MFNYQEFILEKLVENLILESKISFSPAFFKVLASLKNPLSKEILKLHGNDVNSQYNFIDITDQNDVVSFIPDRKSQEIIGGKDELYKVVQSDKYLVNSPKNAPVFKRLEHEMTSDIWSPSEGVIGRILKSTYGTNGKIYVLFEGVSGDNEGKRTILNYVGLENVDDSFNKVWSTSRNNIKIGRIVKALVRNLKMEVTDSEIEKFVNDYKSYIDILKDAYKRFDIVSGQKLVHFYHIDNYANKNRGTLANSCMADVPESYLYIYEHNPEVCKLVVLYSDDGQLKDGKFVSNKIIGRALLWTTRTGEMFLDRIYTNSDSDVELFKKFAEKNGWWSKQRQDSSDMFRVEKGSEIKLAEYVVDLKRWDEEFPYLDSLSYFNMNSGELSNKKELIRAKYQLHSTGGGYDNLLEDYDDDF